MNIVDAKFPPKAKALFVPMRYKVLHGGRGSGKSWSIARALLIAASSRTLRILCTREIQKSLSDSVQKLLADQIVPLGLSGLFTVTQNSIKGVNGSEFVFAGLQDHTVESIKSFEGCDICWVEEAHSVSQNSWDILLPTIRKDGSEVWISFNPSLDSDAVYKMFVAVKPDNAIVIEMNYRDNPFWNDVLEQERLRFQADRPIDDYQNIWEGKCRSAVSGAIYANEIRDLIESNRLCNVPYDPMLKVHVIFDIGWNDSTAIIFAQVQHSELRIIDYIEDRLKTLEYYSNEMKKKGYNYAKVWMPHDARSRSIISKSSAEEQMQAFGWSIEITPNAPIEDGIRTARMIMPRLVIDKTNANPLVDKLRRYTRVINRATGEAGSPLHDENSHGADAFRYFAINAPQFKNGNTRPAQVHQLQSGGWQG
jgi:phage terminase large subunit